MRSFFACLLSVLGALWVASLGDLHGPAFYLAPVLCVWGVLVLGLRPDGANGLGLVGAAISVRVPLLFSPPSLSDDVFRYVWEGEVWRAGLNPFRLAPDAPELTFLRDTIWSQVNHPSVSSIYPPLAQLLFFLLAPGGGLAWKVLAGACDVVSAFLLFRRRPSAGWCWALLPLPALESAGSGHLEGIGVMFLLLALQSGRIASWAAWLGAMLKLLPGLLLPRLLPWRYWPVAAIGSLLAGLCLDAGPDLLRGFETYRAGWRFNASVFEFLLWLGGSDAGVRRALQVLGALVVAGMLWRSRDPGRIALWCCGAFVILSPTVHPWYVLWPLAAGLWGRVRAWALLGALCPLAYVVLSTYNPQTSTWVEPDWPRLVVYPPFFLILGWDALKNLLLPSPSPVH